MKFDEKLVASTIEGIPLVEADSSGKEVPIKYLVGWTLIPPNMMKDGHKNFMPVDALDGAACRGSPGLLASSDHTPCDIMGQHSRNPRPQEPS